MMCHNCASPVFGATTKCCLDGATAIHLMGPGPEIVIVRICDGNGTGSQPVKGTCFLELFFVNLIIILLIYLYIPTTVPYNHRTMPLRTELLC